MRWKPKTETAAMCIVATLLGACGGSAMSARTPSMTYAASPYAAGGTSTASTESMPMSEPASAMAAPAMASAGMARSVATAPMPQAAAHVPVTSPPGGATREANPHGAETNTVSSEAAPMLIYTASVAMTVERPTESIDQAVDLVSAVGGFLAQRNDSMVQVRVPSARFREVLARLERLGEVTHREVQAEDVSEQFHDLDVQLTNLRSVRTRLQEFLSRAANVQEALVVEHELERVGAQIDQIEGRMRFLAARAAFSTITIYVTRRVTAVIDNTPVPTNDVSMPFTWLDGLGVPRLLQLR